MKTDNSVANFKPPIPPNINIKHTNSDIEQADKEQEFNSKAERDVHTRMARANSKRMLDEWTEFLQGEYTNPAETTGSTNPTSNTAEVCWLESTASARLHRKPQRQRTVLIGTDEFLCSSHDGRALIELGLFSRYREKFVAAMHNQLGTDTIPTVKECIDEIASKAHWALYGSSAVVTSGAVYMECWVDDVSHIMPFYVVDEPLETPVVLPQFNRCDQRADAAIMQIRQSMPTSEAKVWLSKDAEVQMRTLVQTSEGAKMFGIPALVDTGATYTLMGRNTMAELGIKREDLLHCDTKFQTAGEEIMDAWGRTKPMKFRIGQDDSYIDMMMSFTVVPKLARGMLLGKDFLHAVDGVVDLMRNQLTVRNTKGDGFSHKYYEPAEAEYACTFTIHPNGQVHSDLPHEQLQWIQNKPLAVTSDDPDWDGALTSLNGNEVITSAVNFKRSQNKTVIVVLQPLRAVMNLCEVAMADLNEGEEDAECKAPLVDDDDEPKIEQMENEDMYDFMVRKLKAPGHPIKTPEVVNKLLQTVDTHKDAFARSSTDLGRTSKAVHEINFHPGSTHFREGVRKHSPEHREFIKKQMQKLLTMGIIERSKSPYASAIVIVGKKDGDMRLCIDFRKLNDLTIKDAFPLPKIADTLDRLKKGLIFTALDLAQGFLQVELKPEDREKTAFVANGELFQWTTMPFGLCNAVATFQRLMVDVLKPVMEKYPDNVVVYVDDILIATPDVELHLKILEEVLLELCKAKLKVKSSKCKFMNRRILFLGRVLEAGTISPDRAHVSRVLDWQWPTSIRNMLSFLGFCNYYREFIYKFSDLVEPLRRIMDIKNNKLSWSEEAERAFKLIKEKLTSAPVLQLSNETGEFVLDTDASICAISGILHQYQTINGKEKLVVIAYAGRSLTGTERNYSSAKAELLAVYHCFRQFREFLILRPFTLRVDCKALTFLKTYSMITPIVTRWLMTIAEYAFTTLHRVRNKHENADALSKITQEMDEYNAQAVERTKCFTFTTPEGFDNLDLLKHYQIIRTDGSEFVPLDEIHKVFTPQQLTEIDRDAEMPHKKTKKKLVNKPAPESKLCSTRKVQVSKPASKVAEVSVITKSKRSTPRITDFLNNIQIPDADQGNSGISWEGGIIDPNERFPFGVEFKEGADSGDEAENFNESDVEFDSEDDVQEILGSVETKVPTVRIINYDTDPLTKIQPDVQVYTGVEKIVNNSWQNICGNWCDSIKPAEVHCVNPHNVQYGNAVSYTGNWPEVQIDSKLQNVYAVTLRPRNKRATNSGNESGIPPAPPVPNRSTAENSLPGPNEDPGTIVEDDQVEEILPRDPKSQQSPSKKVSIAQNRDVPTKLLKQSVKDALPHCDLPKGYKDYFRENKNFLLIDNNDILLRKKKGLLLIVLPPELQHQVVFQTHWSLCHLARDKVHEMLEKQFDWPGMRNEIGNILETCVECQRAQVRPLKNKYPLKPIRSFFPNQVVQFDHLKMKETEEGHIGLLVIVDHFSKYLEAVPVKLMTANETAQILFEQWILRHSAPTGWFQSDRGCQFTADVTVSLMKLLSLEHRYSTPNHPQSNGQVERTNRTLILMVRKLLGEQPKKWHLYIKNLVYAYNISRHQTTGFSPFKIFYGREPATPLSITYKNYTEGKFSQSEVHQFARDMVIKQATMNEAVLRNTGQTQRRNKAAFDRNCSKFFKFKVGDIILAYAEKQPGIPGAKHTAKWRKPSKIVEVLKDGRAYKLDNGTTISCERIRAYSHPVSDMIYEKTGVKYVNNTMNAIEEIELTGDESEEENTESENRHATENRPITVQRIPASSRHNMHLRSRLEPTTNTRTSLVNNSGVDFVFFIRDSDY